MKELDELKEKCIQAIKDVDVFVDEHYEELLEEMRNEWDLPSDWETKIVSNCCVVHGFFRQSSQDEWKRVIYNNGEWIAL